MIIIVFLASASYRKDAYGLFHAAGYTLPSCSLKTDLVSLIYQLFRAGPQSSPRPLSKIVTLYTEIGTLSAKNGTLCTKNGTLYIEMRTLNIANCCK